MSADEFIDPCVVYALASSRDDEWRYIGQTLETAQIRLHSHRTAARRGNHGAVYAWIRAEEAAGFRIYAVTLTESAEMNITERVVIAHCWERGIDLLNKQPGGGLVADRLPLPPVSAETKAKQSAASKGRRHSAETRAKIGAAFLASAWRRREAPIDGTYVTHKAPRGRPY